MWFEYTAHPLANEAQLLPNYRKERVSERVRYMAIRAGIYTNLLDKFGG
jgi:hypothetical protein